MIGLPLAAPAVHERFTEPSAGCPETGESSGAPGLSTTETVMVAVTCRSRERVPSCTVTSTVFEDAPISVPAVMLMLPFEEQFTVSFAESSDLQLTAVSDESGNGL